MDKPAFTAIIAAIENDLAPCDARVDYFPPCGSGRDSHCGFFAVTLDTDCPLDRPALLERLQPVVDTYRLTVDPRPESHADLNAPWDRLS